MATVGEPLTLEAFLRLEDEKPYKEFIDGRIEVKASPQQQHGWIEPEMYAALNGFAKPRGLGRAFVELRCNFAGRSIVPDVVFLSAGKLKFEAGTGRVANDSSVVPDLIVEVLSPDQSRAKSRDKLTHAAANGCLIGWFVDPDRDLVEEFRPGVERRVLAVGDVLEGDPVLPGFRLGVSDIFEWLIP